MCDLNPRANTGIYSNTFPSSKEVDNWHIQEETKYKPSK